MKKVLKLMILVIFLIIPISFFTLKNHINMTEYRHRYELHSKQADIYKQRLDESIVYMNSLKKVINKLSKIQDKIAIYGLFELKKNLEEAENSYTATWQEYESATIRKKYYKTLIDRKY